MPLGNEIGTFSFNITSFTVTPGKGNEEIAQVNMEGEATLDGVTDTVIGTMTVFPNADASTGRWEWCSRAFGEDNTRVALGAGFFVAGGKQFRHRGTISGSDGVNFAVEGEMDVGAKTFSGNAYGWD